MKGANAKHSFLLLILICLFDSIDGNWCAIRLSPNTTMKIDTHTLSIETDHPVNRPNSRAMIHIFSDSGNEPVLAIDVSRNDGSSEYHNHSLTFHINASHSWNPNEQYYITFEEAVLFSNETSNSTSKSNSEFWRMGIDDGTDSTTTTESTTTTTTETTTTTTTTETTTTTATTETTTIKTTNVEEYVHSTDQTSSAPKTSTTSIVTATRRIGEPPPGYAARAGIGVGITFITILICVELIYFNYFYRGPSEAREYDA